MRYEFDTKRLIDIITNILDRANDIKSEEYKNERTETDYVPLFNEVETMISQLEIKAEHEYENAKKRRGFFSHKNIPEPSICIDGIVTYVESHGLVCDLAFPYNVTNHNVLKTFASQYTIESTKDNFYHTLSHHALNRSMAKTFIIKKPYSGSSHTEHIDSIINGVNRRFGNILNSDYILPDYLSLCSDDFLAIQKYNAQLVVLEEDKEA